MIEVLCPFNMRIESKARRSITTISIKIEVPLIIEALYKKHGKQTLQILTGDLEVETFQNACLLGIAQVLKNILDTAGQLKEQMSHESCP